MTDDTTTKPHSRLDKEVTATKRQGTPNLGQLHDLPPTVDLMTAARILGIGRTKAYELARSGEFPCKIIRIGDLYRVATADLLQLIKAGEHRDDVPPEAA